MPKQAAPQTFDEAVAALHANAPQAAAQFARSALALNPEDAASWSLLAASALRAGEVVQAHEAYRRLLILRPDDVDALYGRAETALRLGEARLAQQCLHEARARTPHDPRDIYYAAPAAYALDDAAEVASANIALNALDAAQRVRIATYWALRLQDLGRNDLALSVFARALPDETADAGLVRFLAQLALSANDAEQARGAIGRAVMLEPDHAETLALRARLNVYLGRLDEAHADALAAILGEPRMARAYEILSELAPSALDDEMLAQLDALSRDEEMTPNMQAVAANAAALGLEDQGAFDRAFEMFTRANEITAKDNQRRGVVFSADRLAARVSNVKALFSKDLYTSEPVSCDGGRGLIFIVGLPRSGTTLLDQIVSAHSRVESIGESEAMARVYAAFEEDARESDAGAARVLNENAGRYAQDYLSAIDAAPTSDSYIVDKAPFNFWRVGFIARILPAAKIIIARRDPLDVCLSIYRANFGERFDFKTDLRALGAYYRAFDELAHHWANVLPAPPFEAHHEALLTDPEAASAQLQDYCGLPFEAELTRARGQDRTVFTMSAAQVRDGVQRKGAGRWKNYEVQLAPLREALGDVRRS